MPHPLERLRSTLAELERELETIETLDPETRGLLEEARAEIQEALDERDPTRLKSRSLIERLREREQEFEASYPTLSGIVMRMVNTLAQLGI